MTIEATSPLSVSLSEKYLGYKAVLLVLVERGGRRGPPPLTLPLAALLSVAGTAVSSAIYFHAFPGFGKFYTVPRVIDQT